MDLKPLTYNGRDEGIEITLRTELRPGDDVNNIKSAIHALFPEAEIGEFETETFPTTKYRSIECKHLSFEVFLELDRKALR